MPILREEKSYGDHDDSAAEASFLIRSIILLLTAFLVALALPTSGATGECRALNEDPYSRLCYGDFADQECWDQYAVRGTGVDARFKQDVDGVGGAFLVVRAGGFDTCMGSEDDPVSQVEALAFVGGYSPILPLGGGGFGGASYYWTDHWSESRYCMEGLSLYPVFFTVQSAGPARPLCDSETAHAPNPGWGHLLP